MKAIGTAAAAAFLLCVACEKKKEEVSLAPSATSLEVSKATGGSVVHFELQRDGKTSVEMPGKIEHIVADTSATEGRLDVDLADLAKSAGEVKVDLTTLTTHTFSADKQDDNEAQTGHARNWMEVGSDYEPATRDKYRWATFAIRAIDGVSQADVSKIPAKNEGGEDVRIATLTVHGELLVHGHKANKDVPMEARFYYPAGAKPDSKPARAVFATKGPMRVTLKEHDVRPRDTTGKFLKWTTNLISKVADNAEITFELSAKPTP